MKKRMIVDVIYARKKLVDWLEHLGTIVKILKFGGPKMNQRKYANPVDGKMKTLLSNHHE